MQHSENRLIYCYVLVLPAPLARQRYHRNKIGRVILEASVARLRKRQTLKNVFRRAGLKTKGKRPGALVKPSKVLADVVQADVAEFLHLLRSEGLLEAD